MLSLPVCLVHDKGGSKSQKSLGQAYLTCTAIYIEDATCATVWFHTVAKRGRSGLGEVPVTQFAARLETDREMRILLSLF